jgi:Ser/Thr protein kinase RdoA (MazF antagonist)
LGVSDDALLTQAAAAASRFAVDGSVRDVSPHRGGHINDSFVVTTTARRYLMQRINTRVFPAPDLVMENIAAVTEHIARDLAKSRVPDAGRRVLTVIDARDGARIVRDPAGGAWRMFLYIEGTVSRETALDAADAGATACAFGRFQRQLADHGGPRLHVTIPGFHDTRRRVSALARAREKAARERLARAAAEIAYAGEHDRLADLFGAAQSRYEGIVRIAHHDAKIANILFDETTGEALCVVDLDTVMPGLSLYDFGDLVRSMVSTAAEDERDPARVTADETRFAAILSGYLDGTGGLLRPDERHLLPHAAEAMVFEQGVRFLTDYLEGDTYYKTSRPEQNLDRCRAQFALLASLLEQQAVFSRLAGMT